MQIQLMYACSVYVDRFGDRYHGWLRVTLPEVNPEGKKFWFLLLYPKDDHLAEVAFYTDREMTHPFAEGIGTAEKGNSEGMGITYFFSNLDKERFGMVMTLISLLINCISKAENEVAESGKMPPPRIPIIDVWNQPFEKEETDFTNSVIRHLSKLY